jgi:hypothetical protein
MANQRRTRAKRIIGFLTTAVGWTWAGEARAEDFQGWNVQQSQTRSEQAMEASLGHGAYLPLSMGTGAGSPRSAALAFAGYDAAGRRAVVDTRAELAVAPWLTLQVRAATDAEATGPRPSAGLRIRLLGETASRPGVALGASYKTEGFTEPEGELEGVLALSTHVGAVGLLANLVYGQDVDGHERDAEAGVAATVALRERWLLGVDSRTRLNLAATSGAAPGRSPAPRFDLVAGPLVMCRLGPTFLALQSGVAAVDIVGVRVGAFVLLGFGATL